MSPHVYIYIPPPHSASCKLHQHGCKSCVHLSQCASRHKKKPPAQVADNAHCKCQWGLCANRWQEKHYQCKMQRVKMIALGTSRSRMQQPNACSTRASPVRVCAPLVDLPLSIHSVVHLKWFTATWSMVYIPEVMQPPAYTYLQLRGTWLGHRSPVK